MTIYKTIKYENDNPWQSQLPGCLCYGEGNGRLILFDNTIFCANCGKAYSIVGCVGLVLTKEIKESENA